MVGNSPGGARHAGLHTGDPGDLSDAPQPVLSGRIAGLNLVCAVRGGERGSGSAHGPGAAQGIGEYKAGDLPRMKVPLTYFVKQWKWRDQFSADRFLHQYSDPGLFGGVQLLQCESGRPHGTFVEIRCVVEA